MQIRLTDINTDKVLAALTANGFGTHVTMCPVRQTAESVSIWTDTSTVDDGADGTEIQPCGYEVGLLRREMATFTARHEMVLETNRIPAARLMALMERIASENA